MDANANVIDQAMNFCGALLPESLAGRLRLRVAEWRCEREYDRFADLHRADPGADAELTPDEAWAWVEFLRETVPNLRSYRTRVELRDILGSEPERAQPDLTWTGTVVLPGRFHVQQLAGDDYDEWVTIGDATWETLALMLGLTSPDPRSRRPLVNRLLLVDRWLQAAVINPPTSGWSFCHRKRHVVRLLWSELSPESLAVVLGGDERPDASISKASMHVWLVGDGRFVRSDLVVTDGEGYSSVLVQRVAMHDYPFEIFDPMERRVS